MKIFLRDSSQIKEILLKSGFSQRSLGRKISISAGYINQIINGERNPSGKVAKDICQALKIDFDDIFFIKHDYKSNQKDFYEEKKKEMKK
ncbi:helix-turn-helix transcriptional regulator [Senegalia massiliensis]|uniref:XRE family transcriptional regulator n=1 Tax=Senegalia massiliensis TaxID=1720316 RepID=A0A845QUU1_9CLOT|nr:helix-turn-helix transcriptional regulator [Senegalia massiliensis]NBI05794.1 XRE family transcriptional regulator [Senegalia massiliensis]